MNESLLEALENVRRYAARELHDGIAQTTLQLGLQVTICQRLLEKGETDMLAEELATLAERIELASGQMRDIIGLLRPPTAFSPEASLDEVMLGLIETHEEQGGPPVDYQQRWDGQFPPLPVAGRLAVVRIIEEALLNARKHAQAHKVRLNLLQDQDCFFVIVSDNGQGFDMAEVKARSGDKGGAGIANMTVRAEALGATLSITRNTTGAGTRLVLRLPKS